MKLTTTRAIKKSFKTILHVDGLEVILQYKNPFAYSTRFGTWVCDYYDINNVCLCVGYNPISKKVQYDICKKYSDLFRVYCKNEIDHKKRIEYIDNLLSDFLNEVLKQQ